MRDAGGTGADRADGKPEPPRIERVSATFDEATDTLELEAVFAQPLELGPRLRRTTLLLDDRVDEGVDPGPTVALRVRRDRRAVTVELRWPFDERPACLGGELEFFEGGDAGDHDDSWFLATGVFDRKGCAVAKPVPAPYIAVGEPD